MVQKAASHMWTLPIISAKRFIHDPVALVNGACKGQIAIQPGLIFNEKYQVVFRKSLGIRPQVTILSGGGSGHEPAHAGYVGDGMLDAAVCGAIFASPNVTQIEYGLRAISSPKGILVIVRNYTGDRLNFGLAIEKYQGSAGKHISVVLVGDDISIGKTRSRMVGRRGLAGTVLVHKIAGAAAAKGYSLTEVTEMAKYTAENLFTLGVGLNRCNVPGQQAFGVDLNADEVEIGMGIHNEPGSEKLSPQPNTPELIAEMLSRLLDPIDPERNYLKFSPLKQKSDVVLLMNNLGGLSALELTCLTSIVADTLRDKFSIQPCRTYEGTFLSSLDGLGFSISLLIMPSTDLKDRQNATQIMSFLDASTTATGWTSSLSVRDWESTSEVISTPVEIVMNGDTKTMPCNGPLVVNILTSVKNALMTAEPDITAFDTFIGDGDCGTTLVTGATDLVAAIPSMKTESLSHATLAIADRISKSMGGTSGALYAIFFTAFGAAVRDFNDTEGATSFNCVALMAQKALLTLQQYTAANIGDRTMMDALIPFVTLLNEGAKSGLAAVPALEKAVVAARNGCEATREMVSIFGRSTYVGGEGEIKNEKSRIPDPGACGVVAIVEGILKALEGTL